MQPRPVKPSKPNHELRFNDELAVDVFEVKDCKGVAHAVLGMMGSATHYHIAARVGPGGTPSSRVCAEAPNQCWMTPFGAPKGLFQIKVYITKDVSMHFSKLMELRSD